MGGTSLPGRFMLGAFFSTPHMSPPLYRTTDLYLACFLLHANAVLAGRRRLRPKKSEFSFVADERLHELLRLYWRETPAAVVPARFLRTLTFLKRRALQEPLPKRQPVLSPSLIPSTPAL